MMVTICGNTRKSSARGTDTTTRDYEVRIQQGTLTLAQDSGTTDAMGMWGKHHFEPAGGGTIPWPNGAATVEVATPGFPQTVNFKKASVGITFDPGAGGGA